MKNAGTGPEESAEGGFRSCDSTAGRKTEEYKTRDFAHFQVILHPRRRPYFSHKSR
jgi:hypothetical protein